jgi:hypothetical protein
MKNVGHLFKKLMLVHHLCLTTPMHTHTLHNAIDYNIFIKNIGHLFKKMLVDAPNRLNSIVV